MLASEILTFARDTMLGFDLGFLPEDTELLVRLSEEQRKLLEELVRLDNLALTLPGDATNTVDVSITTGPPAHPWAASYTLDVLLWRIRQAHVTYAAGTPKTLKLVPSNWRFAIPQFTPSAYIMGAKFYPIDGGATRTHGWLGAAGVVFDFVKEPTDLVSGSSVIAAPEEAKGYLGHHLAHFMAVRGKVAAQTLKEISMLRDQEKVRLMGLAKSLPGADQFPPGS